VHLAARGRLADPLAHLGLEAFPLPGQLDREVEAPAVDRAHLDRERPAAEGRARAAVSGHAPHFFFAISARDLLDVLVAAAAQVDDDDLVGPSARARFMPSTIAWRALQGGDDALEPRAELEGLQHLVVRGIGELDPPAVAVEGVLGPDRRVVEARRDRMGELDLAVGVLEDEGLAALQDAELAAGEARRVLARADAAAAGLDPVIRTPGPRGTRRRGRSRCCRRRRRRRARRAAGPPLRICSRASADHLVEIAHHLRIGLRAVGRAEDVVGRADIRDPVAHRLVDRLLERLLARLDAADLGAHQPHPEDVQGLALHVDGAHVDDALEAELGADGRRRHAVLAGARLGDDALLAHPAREEGLADRVVDLVGAGVEQVLALEIDLGAAAVPVSRSAK
jgi:hypothetical protein